MRRRALAVVLVVLVVVGVVVWLFGRGGGSGYVPPPVSGPSVGPGGGGGSDGSGGSVGWAPSSLDGVLDVYGGDVLTQILWANMSDYNVSDPIVRDYLGWLGYALSLDPGRVSAVFGPGAELVGYDVGVGRVEYSDGVPGFWVDGWYFTHNPPSPPPNDGVVRMGIVLIPNWSVALIVTAYYDGQGLNIIIHSRPYNTSKFWEETVYRYTDIAYQRRVPSQVLYRESVPVTGEPAIVLRDNTRIPIKHVVVLIEQPQYLHDSRDGPFEDWGVIDGNWVYYTLLARPAYGLALHLALGSDTSLKDAYIKYTLYLTDSIVRYHKSFIKSPPYPDVGYGVVPAVLGIRVESGICSEYSRSTTVFSTLILGGITDSHGSDSGGFMSDGHRIALLVVPSRVWDSGLPRMSSPYGSGGPFEGPISLTFDVDGDGVNDTGYVLDNIAPDYAVHDWILYMLNHLNPIYDIRKAGASRDPPMHTIVLYGDGWQNTNIFGEYNNSLSFNGILYYTGLLSYVNGLPDWLQPPWHPVFYEEIYKDRPPHSDPLLNLTHDQFVAVISRVFIEPGPDYFNMSAEDFRTISPLPNAPIINVTVPNDMPALHIREVDGSSGGGTPPPPSSNVIEADIYLVPLFGSEETGWGALPSFIRYEGNATVGEGALSENITVRVWPGRVEVVVTEQDGTWDAWDSSIEGYPSTVEFSLFNRLRHYRLYLHYPPIPTLNASIDVELVPDHNQSIGYPNGTLVNVTFYKVNQTLTIGNATIIIYGDVSRLWTTLFIEIYGVPPTNTTLNITAPDDITVNTHLITGGHIELTLEIPPNQTPDGPILTPPGTTITITIQPYNVTVTLTIP